MDSLDKPEIKQYAWVKQLSVMLQMYAFLRQRVGQPPSGSCGRRSWLQALCHPLWRPTESKTCKMPLCFVASQGFRGIKQAKCRHRTVKRSQCWNGASKEKHARPPRSESLDFPRGPKTATRNRKGGFLAARPWRTWINGTFSFFSSFDTPPS